MLPVISRERLSRVSNYFFFFIGGGGGLFIEKSLFLMYEVLSLWMILIDSPGLMVESDFDPVLLII